ncbi:MAG: S41 family peptidase [Chlorobi bacterium]|nr:S41 family peptidase [Chlorobiota bacterium]
MKIQSFTRRVSAALFAVVLACSLSVASLSLLAASRGTPGNDFSEIAESIDLFGDIYRELSENYVEPLDVRVLMYAAIDGMLGVLDPYTLFLDETQSEELGEITSGQYTGIGLSMTRFDDAVYVTSVLEGYPAWNAGIRTGDRITRVDGKPLAGRNLDQVRELMKGATGSRFSMNIEREGGRAPGTVSLVREEVRVSTVSYSGIIGRTGYLQLGSFSSHSSGDMRQAVDKLLREAADRSQPMNGLIIDLRGNPGGLLTAAVDISSLFVGKGSTVVTIRGKKPESEKIYRTEQQPLVPALPLAVLIDKESASASEIVSGAIQDLDRGIVLGERSFGKGLVQSVLRLPYDTTLKLTTAKYYTPSGRLIQKPHGDTHKKRSVLKKNGEKKPLPVYYTAVKRKVYGGGGITPDVVVEAPERSAYEQELRRKGMIFLFASRYRASHAGFSPDSSDRASRLKAFSEFLGEKRFSYTSASERNLQELEKQIAEELNGEKTGVPGSLEGLKKELLQMKNSLTALQGERIARLIDIEIMRHGNETLSRKAELDDDPVVQRALALFADPKAYSRMLRP